MTRNGWLHYFIMVIWCIGLVGCVSSGTQGTAVSGSAGGGASVDASSALERCDQDPWHSGCR